MDSTEKRDSKMILMGGLWVSKSGNSISGPLQNGRLVILTNNKKSKDAQPDYYFFIAENDKKEKEDAPS